MPPSAPLFQLQVKFTRDTSGVGAPVTVSARLDHHFSNCCPHTISRQFLPSTCVLNRPKAFIKAPKIYPTILLLNRWKFRLANPLFVRSGTVWKTRPHPRNAPSEGARKMGFLGTIILKISGGMISEEESWESGHKNCEDSSSDLSEDGNNTLVQEYNVVHMNHGVPTIFPRALRSGVMGSSWAYATQTAADKNPLRAGIWLCGKIYIYPSPPVVDFFKDVTLLRNGMIIKVKRTIMLVMKTQGF